MSTQQPLTTKQFELLTLINDIEEFGREHGNETAIKEIITQDNFMSDEEFDEISDTLHHYGYLNEDDELTKDGKQYIDLFMDYLQKKEKNPDIAINNLFSLIKIDKLNVGLNTFLNNGEVGGKFKTLIERIKNVL